MVTRRESSVHRTRPGRPSWEEDTSHGSLASVTRSVNTNPNGGYSLVVTIGFLPNPNVMPIAETRFRCVPLSSKSRPKLA